MRESGTAVPSERGLPMMKRQRLKAISSDNPVATLQAQDFLARHGRPSTEELREGKSNGGRRGWWELGGADGYRLRCDWVRVADEEQLTFSEVAPRS
jgi:hypothetical protein